MQACRHAGMQACRQAGRQVVRHADKQAGRQVGMYAPATTAATTATAATATAAVTVPITYSCCPRKTPQVRLSVPGRDARQQSAGQGLGISSETLLTLQHHATACLKWQSPVSEVSGA